MKKFCIYCNVPTKDFFVCKKCLEAKSFNPVFLKSIRHRELLSLVGVMIILAGSWVCLFPYLWKGVARFNSQEFRILFVPLFYIFNILGLYFGIKTFQRFCKDLVISSIHQVISLKPSDGYAKKFIILVWDVFFRNWCIVFRLWPLAIITFLMFKLLKTSYILQAFFMIFVVSFTVNFWIGVIFIAPPVFTFLYLDWIKMLDVRRPT